MKKLLIIGGGEMQIPIIKRAKELGHFCIVSDLNPVAPGFKLADIAINISTTDFAGTLKIAKQYNIDGVLTTSDYPVRTVAYISENIGLKGLSLYSANICTDKFAQRKAMQKCGLYVPKNFLISSIEDIQQHVNEFVFPLVIKPIDSSASRGVRKVNTYDELLETFNYAMKYSQKKEVIVEEFIDGLEYSVESLTQDGETHLISITEKSTSGSKENYFVESRHIVPANFDNNENKTINAYVRDIIRCLRLDNSSAHTEVKLSSKGPVLIEIGARLGGDFITSDLVPLATGIDMLENTIRIALGEKIKVVPTKSLYSGIVFINSNNYRSAEKLISTNNGSIIRYELKPYSKTFLTNSLDRLGYIIAVSSERINLINLLTI